MAETVSTPCHDPVTTLPRDGVQTVGTYQDQNQDQNQNLDPRPGGSGGRAGRKHRNSSGSMRWEPTFVPYDTGLAERLDGKLRDARFLLSPSDMGKLLEVIRWFSAIDRQPPFPAPSVRDRAVESIARTLDALSEKRACETATRTNARRLIVHLGADEFYQALLFERMGRELAQFYEKPTVANLNILRLAMTRHPKLTTAIGRERDRSANDHLPTFKQQVKARFADDVFRVIEALEPNASKTRKRMFLAAVLGAMGQPNSEGTVRYYIGLADRYL